MEYIPPQVMSGIENLTSGPNTIFFKQSSKNFAFRNKYVLIIFNINGILLRTEIIEYFPDRFVIQADSPGTIHYIATEDMN